jgi:hypothetical protein
MRQEYTTTELSTKQIKRAFLIIFGWLFVFVFLFNQPVMAQSGEMDKALVLFQKGDFSALQQLHSTGVETTCQQKIDSLVEISRRIQHDFTLSEPEVDTLLQKQGIHFTPDEKQTWEAKGWLENRMINGQKWYFSRAVSNLKLRLQQQQDRINKTLSPLDGLSKFRLAHTGTIIDQPTKNGQLTTPVDFKVTYTITVKPDVVPDGDTLRCWMPYPKQDHARQTNVMLLHTFPTVCRIAPDSVGQRSIYFEQKAKKGEPTVFQISFTYRSYAQSYDLSRLFPLPYKTSSALYRKYTAEQPPHIVFSREIRDLADSIVGNTTEPTEIVRKLYTWINRNIIWSGALEYSTMANIPHYVLMNRKGDCGMQTLLFMSMARYKGIPVKWQSGWMMHPNEVNLHDWSEVYYEGIGWVPVDVSFGLQQSENRRIRDFYISGIDAYRLIINDAISSPFFPPKQFMRSEPVDFQRGEVESTHGNLYFDQWNYSMHVEYVK